MEHEFFSLEILKNNKREIGRENWSSKDGRVLYRCNKSLETKDATKDVSLLISFIALFFYSCVYEFLLITIGKSIVNAAIDTMFKIVPPFLCSILNFLKLGISTQLKNTVYFWIV